MKFAGKKSIIGVIALFALLFLIASCSNQPQKRTQGSSNLVYVRADASLKPTLKDVAEKYSYATYQNMEIQYKPGGEMLDIQEDDSIDVFIFTNDHFIEEGGSNGLLDSTGEVTIAYAVPCLIVPRLNPYLITTLTDLTNPKLRIGIADTSSDVLGSFTLEILRVNNLFDKLDHRLIQMGPTALDLTRGVTLSQVDAAVAWTSSANWNPEGFEVILFTPSEIPRVAIITAIESYEPIDAENADRLITYLNSDRCREIFRNWGYLISESDVVMYAPAAFFGGKPEM